MYFRLLISCKKFSFPSYTIICIKEQILPKYTTTWEKHVPDRDVGKDTFHTGDTVCEIKYVFYVHCSSLQVQVHSKQKSEIKK